MFGEDYYSKIVSTVINSVLIAQEMSKREKAPQTYVSTYADNKYLLFRTRAIDREEYQVSKGETITLLLVKNTPCIITDFFISVNSNNFQLVVIAGDDVIYSGEFSKYDDISEGVKMDAYQDNQDDYYKVYFDNIKTNFSNPYLHIYFRALEDLTIKRLHINYEVLE